MDNGVSSYRRYRNGDEDAFRQIVEEYFDKLVFFIDRYTDDPAQAEDIALDVFAWIAANPGRYDYRVSLKTYLFMLGKSRALDYIRKRKRMGEVPLSEADPLPSQAASPEDMLLTDMRKQAVSKALSQLSEEQRIVVHLIYFEELSCKDAAKVLKKNMKQVYNLLYRAKSALRAILGEEGELLL